MTRRRALRGRPSPLAQRHGLDAIRWAVPPGHPVQPALEALSARFPALASAEATPLAERFALGDIVRSDGAPWKPSDPVAPGMELFFHRELAPEVVPAIALPILLQDEHLLVIDKPHGIATMPRGAHVLGSALARLRRETGIETLVPLHRLDRRTAGVLAFGIMPGERAAYQQLFARRDASLVKVYRTVVPDPGWPVGEEQVLRDRLEKPRGSLQALVVPGEANAETTAVLRARDTGTGRAVVELRPRTGRTHQLRVQLASRGWPIVGEDLYPAVREPDGPLQLLAAELRFIDPVTGERRDLRSRRDLVL